MPRGSGINRGQRRQREAPKSRQSAVWRVLRPDRCVSSGERLWNGRRYGREPRSRSVVRTFTLPGGLRSPPSACSCAENRIDVFAAGPAGLVSRWGWDGTSWIPRTRTPSPGRRCRRRRRRRRFGDRAGGGICGGLQQTHARLVARGWRELVSRASAPRRRQSARGSRYGRRYLADSIDVFAGGPGNTPWWWHWNGTQWSTPSPLPVGANIPAERLAAVSPAPGRLDVFAPGAGNHLWHWMKVGALPWRAPVDRGGNLPVEGVSAVSWGPNRVDVFAASGDPGSPLQHWWSSGGGFSGPREPRRQPRRGNGERRLACRQSPRRFRRFLATSGSLIGSGTGGTGIGPDYHGDGIPAGDVSAVVRTPHRLDVFVAGAGNTMLQWPGGGLENATTQPWRNWPTNQARASSRAPAARQPEELVSIVKEAERLGRGVRAVGSQLVELRRGREPGLRRRDGQAQQRHQPTCWARPEPPDRLAACGSCTSRRGSSCESSTRILDGQGPCDTDDGRLVRPVGRRGRVDQRARHGCRPRPDPGHGSRHPPRRAWRRPALDRAERRASRRRHGIKHALGLADENIHYDDDWFNSVLVSMGSLGSSTRSSSKSVPQYDLVDSDGRELDWSDDETQADGRIAEPRSTATAPCRSSSSPTRTETVRGTATSRPAQRRHHLRRSPDFSVEGFRAASGLHAGAC